jgi:hypothetical protein
MGWVETDGNAIHMAFSALHNHEDYLGRCESIEQAITLVKNDYANKVTEWNDCYIE